MTKRILDEETKRALQGYTPFSCETTVEFTPSNFAKVKPEYQPKFKIRCLTQAEKTQLKTFQAEIKKDSTGNISDAEYEDFGKKVMSVYRLCLMGWRDYFDCGTGAEIDFKSEANGAATVESWQIVETWHNAISIEVRKISNLTSIEALSLK